LIKASGSVSQSTWPAAAAGAAIAGTTLVLYFNLMRLKRHQQRRVLFPAQHLSAGKTERYA
jgi:hypothetical protein